MTKISKLWTDLLGRPIASEHVIGERELCQALDAGPPHVVQCWWVDGSAKHVVLVVGHADGYYLVYDPCCRPKLMSYEELKRPEGAWKWKYSWIL